MITLTGADLCMGSFMFTTVAVLRRRLTWWEMLIQWVVTFLENLAGSLWKYLPEPYKSEIITFATKKQVVPDFHMIFLRGIGCNWLVCLACFLGLQGLDLASKILGI
ncbi:hypothetical protein EYZ11_009528 [Aspergillus tanneri]|uniref:Uncharacterized protein n=1 Tax=Aspergillus tanneri TaxID=1220188 RepID=A0A4S3J7X1_9EURO|nr:hypothetical protein EYZ11_009528 [Aspergillus tanneri]